MLGGGSGLLGRLPPSRKVRFPTAEVAVTADEGHSSGVGRGDEQRHRAGGGAGRWRMGSQMGGDWIVWAKGVWSTERGSLRMRNRVEPRGRKCSVGEAPDQEGDPHLKR